MGLGLGEELSDLRGLVGRLQRREAGYALVRRYYEGEHDLLSVGPEYLKMFREVLEGTRYNRCAGVVDTLADKLQVSGFINASGDVEVDREVARGAQAIWRRNRMDRRAGEVHSEALLMGDAYVVVWPNALGEAVISPQEADRCVVRYSEEDLSIEVALKVWRLGSGCWRANLYYLDHVEKFISVARGRALPSVGWSWERFLDEDGVWPLRYPWGVGMPVFHFANNARSGMCGRSELRDVIPLQDALNKSLANQVVAGEFASIPQRYVIGAAMERDAAGNWVNPFKNVPGALWWLGPGDADDAQARFGEFSIGDITQFTVEQDSLDRKIAQVARIPQHYLGMSGDFPSGEAQKTAETMLTNKTVDRQIAFGNVWEDVARFCLFVEGVGPLDSVQLSTQWLPAAPRSEVDFWSTAVLKMNAGVPGEHVWREAGYDEDLIAKWAALVAVRDGLAAGDGERLRRALNDQ